MNTVVCHAIIREERQHPEPYGDGSIINAEIVSVHRHHASAMEALQAEREDMGRYLSSRFRAYLKSERVEESLAESVPA